MDAQLYRAQISQLTPINSLSQKNFDVLLSKAEVLSISPGDYLFKEGDVDKSHLFLLDGSLLIKAKKGSSVQLDSHSDEAKLPIAQHQPRNQSARALSPLIYLKIESQSLEMMLSWDHAGSYEVEEINESTQAKPGDWMGNILRNPIFQRIPPNNLQDFFMSLKPIKCSASEIIITQGEPGDYFYIMSSGSATITRTTPSNPEGITLGEIGPGEFFGEDALISDLPRSASVQILEDSNLMRLSKIDFMSLVNEPCIDWIEFPDAAELVRSNQAIWLDVRLPGEYEHEHQPNSINIPLLFLRTKLTTLNSSTHYITCCDTGDRSAAAAFLLRKSGFDAQALKDGLQGASPVFEDIELALESA
jgi:CRP-like cAMP-binding protein